MPLVKYAYLRGGAPILDWESGPPRQSRAADTVALGSLAGTTLDHPTLELPVPGGPEPLSGNCGCSGSCGCTGMGDLTTADTVIAAAIPALFVAGCAWIALDMFRANKKRRRR